MKQGSCLVLAMQDSNAGRAIYRGRDDLGFLVLNSGAFSCSHSDLVSLLLFTLPHLVLCCNHRSKDLYRSKGKGHRVCLGGRNRNRPRQKSQCGNELNKLCPPNRHDDLCLCFCINLSSMLVIVLFSLFYVVYVYCTYSFQISVTYSQFAQLE